MVVALGTMALALAMLGGAPDATRGGVPIKYSVRVLEVEGLGWRDAVFARLTPVTRQGAATVWTAPADVAKRLISSPSINLLRTPSVIAWSGTPAHIATPASRQIVSRVSRRGDARSIEAQPETIRMGSAATMAGRKLDQGVLVRMVLKDTQILAVHRVALGDPGEARSDPAAKKAAYHAEACEGASSCCETGEDARKADTPRLSFEFRSGQWIPLPPGRYMTDDVPYFPSGPDFPWAKTPKAAQKTAGKTQPARASKTPSGAVAASASASGCCSAAASCPMASKDCEERAVSVEVPEIGSQEIAGEWLIPNDGILLVSFGPHTIAGEDGKAVIRERLAIVEAEEAAAPARAWAPRPEPWGAPMPHVPTYPNPAAIATSPAPAAVPAPAAAMPPMPSRSFPQGYHADGKVADLPPLPPDEAADDDDSAEPRPSPQKKKARPAGETPEAKSQAPGDTATKKAQFTLPNIPSLPTLFQPAQAVGLQFLLPIRPVSLKLPFNRRLELEIYGRVIRAPEPARSSADLATKDAATTR